MSDAAAPLTTEEYGQLYGMLKSEDAGVRAQAKSLTSKLTPAEEQSFFDYQKSLHPKDSDATSRRLDSNVATVGNIGVAPEDVLMAGQGVRKIAGATAAGGAMAGVKQAIATAAPQVKYEIARTGLRAIGVPAGVAEVLAIGISNAGGKSKSTGARGPKVNPAEVAAKAKIGTMGDLAPPPPAPPPAGAPSIAEAVAPVAESVAKSPQWALNNIAIQARRLGVKLTEAEVETLKPAVQAGMDPAAAVASLKTPSIADLAEDPAAAFAARFNLPSDAERRWPVNKSGLPSDAPKADAKYRRAK